MSLLRKLMQVDTEPTLSLQDVSNFKASVDNVDKSSDYIT